MSTGWITDPVIPFDELRAAELDGAWVSQGSGGADNFALTDGKHYVQAYRHEDMGHAYFEVNVESKNEPGASAIRDAVSDRFGVDWYNESDQANWEEPDGPEGPVTVHSDLSSRGGGMPFLRMALAMTAVRTADAYSPFHDAPGEGGPGLLERLEEWLREAEGDLEVMAMASQTVDEARQAFARADLPPREWDASLADIDPDLSATYEFQDHGDGGWNVDVALSHGGTEFATVPMVEAGTGREEKLAAALSAAGL